MTFVFRKRCKSISLTILFIYILFSLFTSYKLLNGKSNEVAPSSKKETKDVIQEKLGAGIRSEPFIGDHDIINTKYEDEISRKLIENPVVEIWGKAAIGLYLWEHILGGSLKNESASFSQRGKLRLRGIEFWFRTGPGIVQGYVPTDVKYLILVLNGRDDKKIAFAKAWLDYVDQLPRLRRAALVLLGDEKCDNDWLLPYMAFRGGKIEFAFLTYDSPLVDNVNFYQWPLGVATYRKFPKFEAGEIRADTPRAHLCNFLGTVYPGSSRQTLVKFLSSNTSVSCFIRSRQTWMPSETKDTLTTYVNVLKDSFFTLSPIGVNSEAYRIYEALSCGSIPVVENVMSEGNCGGGRERTPYRLLKSYHAPLMYVTNWEVDLPPLIAKHKSLSAEQKQHLNRQILDWYRNFKLAMKRHFLNVVELRFFNITAK